MSDAGSAQNNDWTQSHKWDIWWQGSLIYDRWQLEEFVAQQGITIDEFLQLPAAQAMPESLRSQL